MNNYSWHMFLNADYVIRWLTCFQGIHVHCTLMSVRVWNFKDGGSKNARFLPKNDMLKGNCFKIILRFTQICKKFAAFARKIVFVIVSEQFYYRNNNKNNFVSKFSKFLANLCKSSEILEQCHVNWWLDYRIFIYLAVLICQNIWATRHSNLAYYSM